MTLKLKYYVEQIEEVLAGLSHADSIDDLDASLQDILEFLNDKELLPVSFEDGISDNADDIRVE